MEFSGNIQYTLKIENGTADIQFKEGADKKQEINNELAILFMAQLLVNNAIIGLEINKDAFKGEVKKIMEDQLRSVTRGRQGLRTLCNIFLDEYQHMNDEIDKPKITVENGTLTEEEILKLPNGEEMLKQIKEKKNITES